MHYQRSILRDRRRWSPTRFAPKWSWVLRCGLPRRPVHHWRAHRAVADSANFADSYQIDPDLSII